MSEQEKNNSTNKHEDGESTFPLDNCSIDFVKSILSDRVLEISPEGKGAKIIALPKDSGKDSAERPDASETAGIPEEKPESMEDQQPSISVKFQALILLLFVVWTILLCTVWYLGNAVCDKGETELGYNQYYYEMKDFNGYFFRAVTGLLTIVAAICLYWVWNNWLGVWLAPKNWKEPKVKVGYYIMVVSSLAVIWAACWIFWPISGAIVLIIGAFYGLLSLCK